MDRLNDPNFTTYVEDLLKKHHVPGLNIAITHNGATASAGYGYASLDPPVKCSADTLFDIASSSKSLTAASVALLVEDENHLNIKWDATMSSLLPEDFVMAKKEYTDLVTLEDILSHRSGIAR